MYRYPVLPSARVPGAQYSHVRSLLLAAAVIAIIVGVISAIVQAARPTTNPCGVACRPHTGLRLLNAATYTNQQFGYTVAYDANLLSVGNQDQNGVQLQATNGDGEIDFTATSGSDVSGAVAAEVNNLNTNQFQNMQQIGPVRGAEIGLVLGQGLAYSADFVPPDGTGQSVPVGLVVMAASQGGITITVTAFSAQSMDIQVEPYGLDVAQAFDFPVTNTIWKGQQ